MTPELAEARCGKLTASKAAVIMGKLDTDGLESYVKDLAWERVYGVEDEEPQFESEAMKRGKLLEEHAVEWYVFKTGHDVDRDENRCIEHPDLPFVGASPEALVNDDATLEIKVPLHKAWMEVLARQQVPAEYRWQCRWHLWVTGRQRADFVCWHPRSGGIIVPLHVSAEECKQMHIRAMLVNERVQEWEEVLRRVDR